MTEYIWSSPGGVYVVPDSFRERFLADFPNYRIRWSLSEGVWCIEQRCGNNVIPPIRVDPHDDELIRAVDGYYLFMKTTPGDRTACSQIVSTNPIVRCGCPVKVALRRSRESICHVCRSKRRDGRTMAAYYPFDEFLLDHMRRTNPLTYGIVKHEGKLRTAAGVDADAHNHQVIAARERATSNAITSLDAVDYRWISGIPTAGVTRRAYTSLREFE